MHSTRAHLNGDVVAWRAREAASHLRRAPRSALLGAARAVITIREAGVLLLATLLSGALSIAVAVLAWPGSPWGWSGTFIDAVQQPSVLVPLAALVTIGLLWSIRLWVLRKRLRDPGPILLLPVEDGTAAPVPTPTIALTQPAGDAPTVATVIAPAPDATGAVAESPPVARLATHFRVRLSELDLSAPTLVPGRPTSTDFVELLGTTKIDIKQPFALVGKLLRLVLPSHAYEVKATVLEREAEPRRGVSIEVTILFRRRTVFRTFWSESWESALDRAATAIGALVVPLSRLSERGTWSSWRGAVIDEQLFDHYQRYQRFSQERRYEEAMASLYAALRLDPGNHHIRFQLGLLQEELALYVDALLTYHSVRRGLEERLEGGVNACERRELERLELIARYRATILLGWGERLAEQWMPAPHGRGHSKRSRELAEIRARLRPALVAHYSELELGPQDRAALGFGDGDLGEQIEALLADEVPPQRSDQTASDRRRSKRQNPGHKRGDSPEELAAAERRQRREATRARREDADRRRLRSARLSLLFGLFAGHDVKRFLAAYRDHEVLALGTEITPLALRLLPAWSRVRAHGARLALPVELRRLGEPSREPEPPRTRRLRRRTNGEHARCEVCGEDSAAPLSDAAWPPCPHVVLRLWNDGGRRMVLLKRALKRSDVFLDHYNAACTFAVALLPGGPGGVRRDDARVRALARAAVEELEVAVRVAGSVNIAAQWDWILKEDPDLAGLRAEPEFQNFESERFPSSEPSPVRPSDIVKLQATRHSAQLFRECAERLESQWHRRADAPGPIDAHAALTWWEEEREAWRLARDLSLNHRHWQTRLEVIRRTQQYCRRHGLDEFWLAQPAYSEERIDEDTQRIDTAARREILYANQRNDALDSLLDLHRHDDYAESWERYLMWLDVVGRPLDEETARHLAVNRASAWADLRLGFDHNLSEQADLDIAKRSLVAAAARMAEIAAPLPGALATVCGRRRILVVANRTLYGENLREALVERARQGAELHFAAPIFGLRLRYNATNPGEEVEGARKRLLDALAWARDEGIRATASVGEETIAIGAIEDELRRAGADEVIVSTLPPERSNWLAAGIVERLQNALSVPVVHIVVDARVEVTVTRAEKLAEVHAMLRNWLPTQVPEPDAGGTTCIAVDGVPLRTAETDARIKLSEKFPGALDEWILVRCTTARPPDVAATVTQLAVPELPANGEPRAAVDRMRHRVEGWLARTGRPH